jgi:adenylate kinase
MALQSRYSLLHRLSRKASSSTQPSSVESLSAAVSAAVSELAAAGGQLNWVLCGAPGVGKGTYASRLATLLRVPHVSAGDLVRDEIKAGTPLAKQARPPPRPASLR